MTVMSSVSRIPIFDTHAIPILAPKCTLPERCQSNPSLLTRPVTEAGTKSTCFLREWKHTGTRHPPPAERHLLINTTPVHVTSTSAKQLMGAKNEHMNNAKPRNPVGWPTLPPAWTYPTPSLSPASSWTFGI